MADVVIRQAGPADCDAVFRIEQECFAEPWSEESIRKELTDNPRAFYVVAELNGEVVGFAGLWWIIDEGHITNVAVLPEHRNRGIAQAMVSVMVEFTEQQGIRHHTLEVRRSNMSARHLYEKLGFAVEGVRKAYYSNNKEDALVMWRHSDCAPENK